MRLFFLALPLALSLGIAAPAAAGNAFDLVLAADPWGVEIVAARAREGARRPLEQAPRALPGTWLEIVDREGVTLDAIHLGDPLLAPYDDWSGPEPRVGLARLEERLLFVPLALPAGASQVRVVGADREVLDRVDRAEIGRLAARPGAAAGAVVEAVRITGDPGNRLDLLFMGDGYRVEEWPRFRDDVDACADALLASEPFLSYPTGINLWRLPLRSAESGADHPCEGIRKQTRLDASYDWPACRTRMMSYDYLGTWLTAGAALPEWDHLIVLVNDPERAGAMPPFAPGPVYSNRDFDYLTVHEWIGHDLARLMDEYDATEDVGPIGVPYNPNCSLTRLLPPWRHWIREGEPGIGAFPNCAFDNLYRPTDAACVMRVLWPLGFDAFCRERAIKGLFLVVSPIDGTEPPAGSELNIGAREEIDVEVRPLQPVNHLLHYSWLLDGTEVQAGERHWYTLEGDDLGVGSHTLRVEVEDPNPMVLKDRRALLSDAAGWHVIRRQD